LKSGHREYEQCLELPAGYVRSKPKYSQAQKTLAVEHYLEHGRCVSATIKALGYPGRASLHAWITTPATTVGAMPTHRHFEKEKPAATRDRAG
jgi:transposase-like protein